MIYNDLFYYVLHSALCKEMETRDDHRDETKYDKIDLHGFSLTNSSIIFTIKGARLTLNPLLTPFCYQINGQKKKTDRQLHNVISMENKPPTS